MISKITKRSVDNAQSGDKPAVIWDTEIKGFGLKVTPKGKKVYILQYRRLNCTKIKRHTIGAHGSPWTPEQARTKAITLLAEVKNGRDIQTPKDSSEQITISKLCDLYFAKGTRTKKQSTIDLDKSNIRSHVIPLIGHKELQTITPAVIEQFMHDISNGKTAKNVKTGHRSRTIVSGGKGAANRTLDMLGAIFEFSIREGLLGQNPVKHVKKFPTTKKERFLTNTEFQRLGASLKRALNNGTNPYAIFALKLLLLTGCRKNEIVSLKWADIDFDNHVLNLQDSKTGAKQVYLSEAAVNVFKDIPRINTCPFVFPSSCGTKPYGGLQKVWNRIRNDADLDEVRIHDLRHSFASIGARNGQNMLMLSKLLGHSKLETTKIYAHLSDEPALKATNEIGDHISKALDNA